VGVVVVLFLLLWCGGAWCGSTALSEEEVDTGRRATALCYLAMVFVVDFFLLALGVATGQQRGLAASLASW